MAQPSGVLNPYARNLGDRDPIEVIRATPQRLEALAKALGPSGLERSLRPGSWSARQILAHLADTEVAFAFRVRQCLAEEHHVIQPFNQDRWNALLPERDAASSLASFRALREGVINLVKDLPPAALGKPVMHPERGEMTLRTVIETIGGHDLNHLEQLERINAAT